MIETLPFTLDALAAAYAEGLRPEQVVSEAFRRLGRAGDPGIFIHAQQRPAIEAATRLGLPTGHPLWGVPFAVKDNIDVVGMPTTAGCPDFAYEAGADAFVVARLREAGAIPIGKTNLDQFATGLVGVRTPYPIPRNALDDDIVPGGSSSGSAVAVARGIVSFALGTDTAGSGRVPAALNAVVGLKPTLGALSAGGMVPACRTLDTISILGLTVADAWRVFAAASGPDAADAYSRRVETGALFDASSSRIGVPDAATLRTFGDRLQEADFRATTRRLAKAGATLHELDFSSFYAVARLLYEGAWVAERVASVGARLTARPDTLHPVTLSVLEPGLKLTAAQAFEGAYALKALRRECEALLATVDLLCVPTIPCFVTLAEIAADPLGPNARLGTYTNFVNLLDLCGIAAPTGLRTDGRPGGVTFLAAAGRDALCASLAASVEAGPVGATAWPRTPPIVLPPRAAAGEIALAVCGAHMSGLPLNREITERGGRLVRRCRTAPDYALHALSGGPPYRPGMIRRTGGAAIEVEVWALPSVRFGDFMAGVPSPLAIGTVELEDGSFVKGFLCEASGLAGSSDITHHGGWRAYLADRSRPPAEAAA